MTDAISRTAARPAMATARLRRVSVPDTIRVVGTVLAPLVAQGVIARRPRIVALAQAVDADRRANRLLTALRRKYGRAPLWLRIPGRCIAIVTNADDARRVLTGSPEPFAVASRDKRGALAHFQPAGVLVSTGAARAERRRFNEVVLQPQRPVHEIGDRIASIVDQEVALLPADGRLGWTEFTVAWWRIVRRTVLGDAARTDSALTDLLAKLRKDANWSHLRPRWDRRRAKFHRRLASYLQRAEPGSLAGVIARAPTAAGAEPQTRPGDQVAQWLFGYDSAGMATWRALALLTSHPAAMDRARDDGARDGPEPTDEYLRACIHESARLWPTTPVILRDTTIETDWSGGTLPAGTALVVYTPLLHRDRQAVPYADRFNPEAWLHGHADRSWSVLPFSAGPAECPGRSVVLQTGARFLGAMLDRYHLQLLGPARLARAGSTEQALPGTLSPFGVRFAATAWPSN